MSILRNIIVIFFWITITSGFSQDKIQILSSASMFADMAQVIGGDKVVTRSIVPIGGDPHIYSPSPSDVSKVLSADIILVNGLTFEGWIKKLIDNSGTKAEVRILTKGIDPIANTEYANAYDPHAWMAPANGLIYIKNILEALVHLSPENEAYFRKNYESYKTKIIELDSYISMKINTIPLDQRVLITSHDAFAYYGIEYGMALHAIKGISTEEETQVSDIVRVSNIIKKNKVKAIFIESTINPKMIQQISKDSEVAIGGELYADSLGPKGSDGDTYLKMLRHNTDVIVNALAQKSTTKTKIDGESTSGNLWVYLMLGFAMIGLLVLAVSKFK